MGRPFIARYFFFCSRMQMLQEMEATSKEVPECVAAKERLIRMAQVRRLSLCLSCGCRVVFARVYVFIFLGALVRQLSRRGMEKAEVLTSPFYHSPRGADVRPSLTDTVPSFSSTMLLPAQAKITPPRENTSGKHTLRTRSLFLVNGFPVRVAPEGTQMCPPRSAHRPAYTFESVATMALVAAQAAVRTTAAVSPTRAR